MRANNYRFRQRLSDASTWDMLGHSSIAITNTYVGLFRDGKGMAYNLDLASG